ncbi:MAG: glycerol-3-phosphate 1-O-acyltransferase PlsY [Candidatus Obscuribacterales bacterium]
MFGWLLAILAGYLLGSIPTGYWVGKLVKGIDIREHGSKSTGATNVLRCVGKGPALFVFLFDIFKAYAPVWVSATYTREISQLGPAMSEQLMGWHVLPTAVAVMELLGHSKSIFLGFTGGGKSAAVALGSVFAMNPLAALLSFFTWLTILGLSRFVSLASILATASSAVWVYLVNTYFHEHPQWAYILYCSVGGSYVIYRHKANIKRLLSGTEPKIGQKADTEKGETTDQSNAKKPADKDETKNAEISNPKSND